MQKKLEETLDHLRVERERNANIKQEIIQRDNYIEQLKHRLKEKQADIKLANLENECMVRQCEYERRYASAKELKPDDVNTPHQNPRKVDPNLETTYKNRPKDVSESYLDMSYSQSPSMIMKSGKYNNNEDLYNYTDLDKSQAEKKLNNYNQHLLKSLEMKTLKPLGKKYESFLVENKMPENAKRYLEEPEVPPMAKKKSEADISEFKNQNSVHKERGKSVEPTASKSITTGFEDVKMKEPTYIQKLLGLQRANSNSSNKYHTQVPVWQKLLKGNNDQNTVNQFGRRLSFGKESNTSDKLRNAANMTVGEI